MTRKVDALAQAVTNGLSIRFVHTRDEAGLDRLREMLSKRKATLDQVTNYVAGAFRRLYNQRNVIMHSAKFQSVTMRATMRTVPALAAAGMDRIVNAERSGVPLSALQLAARADAEIGLVAGDSGRALHKLLD